MSLESQLKAFQKNAITTLAKASTSLELEEFRIQFLGKKGELTEILKSVGQLSADERPKIGKLANEVKMAVSNEIDTRKSALSKAELDSVLKSEAVDVTMPGIGMSAGARHPISIVIEQIESIFARLGFSVKEGPEIEDDFHNFEALNIPADHPARDMHDTFYLKDGSVLRTHTSPVQIHEMQKTAPPVRIIVPGKVFRCDADVTHSPVFHQVEGLYVDTNVTFAELKGTLEFFLKEIFGHNKEVRFRSSYFPFTEPSCEVDVQCTQCSGKGCSLCKQTGWLEILGAGMVNRNVFKAVGYDPDVVTGFAFGLGVERIAMLRYGIHDIRLFYENDGRFLSQFVGA